MIRFRREFYLVPLLVALVAGSISAQDSADLVLRGGKIVTVDDAQPLARALAVRGDRIVAVGKLADMVVLSNDILTCPADEILQTKVVTTIVAGQVAFADSGSPSE